MIMSAGGYRHSGIWQVRVDQGVVVLVRPTAETVIVVDEVDAGVLEQALEGLASGATLPEALALLNPLGADPRETLTTLEELQVVRKWRAGGTTCVEGDGPLAEIVRSCVGRYGWQSELPVVVFSAENWQDAALRLKAAGLAITSLNRGLIAVRTGGAGCVGCLVLRALGRVGVQGEDPRVALTACDLDERSMVMASELFFSIEQRALDDAEGIWIARGLVSRGQIIAHPDCPCGRRDESGATADFPTEIWSAQDTGADALEGSEGETALVNSPFAPTRLHELHAEPQTVPLGVPFLWGDTCLARHLAGVTRNVSIPGIIHGGGQSSQECRIRWMSEAVERLAAQSARWDVVHEITPELERSCKALYDRWPRRAKALPFCHGVDLLRSERCLVPFERVAVGLTHELDPQASYRESTFTGTAAHVTLADAILNATVEAIKRDAYLVAWYRRRRLRPVLWPPAASRIVDARTAYLRENGLALDLFALTLDIPLPLLLLRVTATRRLPGWPAGGVLLVPAGGFRAEESLDHALKLAAARFVSLCHAQAEVRDPCDPEDVQKFAKESVFWPLIARYLNPSRAEAHGFLNRSRETALPFSELPACAVSSPGERLLALRDWLEKRRIAWTAVRLTDSVARIARREVARVALPQLMRIAASREEMDLSSPRLSIELADAELEEANPDPHPIY